jgi:hypothetical protein
MRKTSSCFCHRPLSPHPRRNRTGDDQRFFSRDCGIRMRELIDWSTAILAVESTHARCLRSPQAGSLCSDCGSMEYLIQF